MIGTLAQRLRSSLLALIRPHVAASMVSIHGTPAAVRHVVRDCAIEDMTFDSPSGFSFMGIPVVQERLEGDDDDRIWICFNRRRVVVIELNALPNVSDQCPDAQRAFVTEALSRVLPRVQS